MDTITIDALNAIEGPFTNVILWLDIEGFEYEALVGAADLLTSGEVLLVNVEILERRPEVAEQIHTLLTGCGFSLAGRWNEHVTHHDRIYVPRKAS